MSIFDGQNQRLDIRILDGGTVWLEQATRYFYFADSDPISHLPSKTGYKWDETFDGTNALPTAITLEENDLVGAVPIQVLNEFLATGTINFTTQGITLPGGAAFPTFTFSGGDVHSWNYVTHGLTSTNGSHTVPSDINLDQIWIDGNDVWPLEDSLELISEGLQDHWNNGLTLQDLGGKINSVIKSDLETQISKVGATAGGESDIYYALIELDPSAGMEAQEQAIYMTLNGGVWVKPVAFDTALELRNYLLDQNDHAIEGIWDIGVFLSDTIPTAAQLETKLADDYFGSMGAEAQQFFYSNAYTFSRMDLWNDFSFVDVAAAYTAAGYNIVTNDYPAGIDLDIYNVNTVKLHAGTNPDAMINGLQLSNNNDITLEVYLTTAAPSAADFSSFSSAHTVVLSAYSDTSNITLDTLNFGASQTVVLENSANSGTVNASFSTYNGSKVAPAKIIVEDGVHLDITLDSSVNVPEIVNQGGTVEFTGDVSGNYIEGTNGADLIEGMGGDDILTGGKGADVFVIEQDSNGTGNVTITDFDSNDTIRLLKSDGSTLMTEVFDKDVATTTAGVYFKEENSDSDYIMYSFQGGSVYAKDVSDPIYDVPFDFGNDNKFEIYEIPGERYGNIVTFGVRPKGEFIDTDFSQIDFGVTFDTAEFEYFTDSFEIGSQTKAATDASSATSTKLLEVNDASGAEGRLSFSAGVDGATLPMAYDAHVGWTGVPEDKPDDYVAKFMLKRIDQNPGNNDLQILFADHATWDATNGEEVFDNVTPENFTFNYAKDIVTVKMTNPSGTVAPGSELFVSTATVSDGLSLNPTLQIEDLVKYEVVLNVSVPTVRSSNDSATSPTNASLKISGAEIFDVSVEADLETSLGTPTSMTKNLDDGGSVALLSGTEGEDTFINAISTLGDTRTDTVDPDWTTIDSSESLELSFAGLAEQTSVGRFKVAEFWARQDDSGIQYSYSNDGGTTYSDEITMTAEELSSIGTLRTVVNDGADVALLGNGFYVNPFNSYRAITGYDALQALRISVDDESNPSYSLESFVAADYDFSGTVNASDALGILETAAYVDEDERTTDASPMWTYIQTNVGSKYVTLGDNGTDITVAHDDDIDQFIGVNTHIEAVAVLKGDTSHSYKYLPEVIDPLFYFLDGFLNTGADVGGTASATTPATPAGPTTLTYVSGTTKFNISDTDPGGNGGVASVITANSGSKQDAEDYDVIRVTDDASTNWDDVANVMSGAISENNATAGDGDTLVFISNGSDARGYMYSDNGTDGVTDAEIQHVYTLSGMTDVTDISSGDLNVPRPFTLYNDTTAPTSSAETHDFGGSADHYKLVFDSAAVAAGDTVTNFDRGLDQLVLDVDMSSTTNLSVVEQTSATTAGVPSVISSAASSWTAGTATLDVLLVSITDQPSGEGSNVKQYVIVDADNSGDYNANSDYNFYVSNYGGMVGMNDVSFGFDAAITFM